MLTTDPPSLAAFALLQQGEWVRQILKSIESDIFTKKVGGALLSLG